ncbi:hypothetical protein B0H19DRAFT_1208170 [Mycena capillaripes]|nr:hypothetical protein B0H19DRAFT_1208170 [Mycena capillaripes]
MDATSDDEMQERSDEEDDNYDPREPTVTVDDGDNDDNDHREKRARNRDHTQYSRQWYPWTDRITCTLDILMHLPRSLFLWLLKVNNVDDVPSVKSMQELNAMLQKLCGIETIGYDGALGHKYYVNSLAQILSQEMSNPKVRPHLEFYPEDTGKLLDEARQGKRWLEELPSAQTTPIIRKNSLGETSPVEYADYFIHEPAMLDDGTFCMPIRWFIRDKSLIAKCWDLSVVTTETGQSWRSFLEIRADISLYSVPDPSKIHGAHRIKIMGITCLTSLTDVQDPISGVVSAWDMTDPAVGNPWRERPKGARVLAFPIWLYCDDTSGNLSKKWNEHNSFLFTPAGLPREQAQKKYNIHFLCTSNIAPPLEMLDGVLDQLESGQKDGIWAWESRFNELVLVIPSVLALLGDNPMQSEFACHIGLRGKYFCRACWVKGSDAMDEEDVTDSDAGSGVDSAAPNESLLDTPLTATASTQTPNPPLGTHAFEKWLSLFKLTFFFQIGPLRTKEETTKQLKTYFDEASTLNTKTKVKSMRTASGIKDTFQMVFLENLFNSYKNTRGKTARQAALDAQRRKLPKNITSPILHVILLGFVKYMWRDLVQNQLQNKDDLKSLLETRLNSFDVSSLGISPLAGHTLVQYSGSLVGRDFRAIAQAAPFVVYDLVSKDCLATWVALSKIIPLIWQPSIKDIDAHIALLTAEINHFLTCAARWTTRWFNKPKFHILLHLPAHIRRFGPAILFATEAFKSFNAIIRAKSVHSNCHAPSRDIARAFAQGNRIRHLLSGGLFMKPSLADRDWAHAGPGPLSLVSSPNTVTPYLGLDGNKKGTHGICVSDKLPARSRLPHSLRDDGAQPTLLKTNSEMYLDNGDHCQLDAFVIAKQPNQTTFIARVQEILQIKGSADDFSQRPSADILCTVNVQHNCAVHECADTGFRRIYQERQATEQTRPMIAHGGPELDLLLNTCQMRDTVNLQSFRINSLVLDSEIADKIIESSILQEVQQKKAAGEKALGAAPNTPTARAWGGTRGRGMGRGRARGRGAAAGALPAIQRLAELQGQGAS